MSTEFGFSALVAIWADLALPALVFGLLEWDPVGRKGGKGLGPQINSRVAWTVIEIPALLVFPLVYLSSGNLHLVGNVLVGVWIAHYLHRTVIWPWIVVRKSSTASISLVLAGGSFNVVNGLVLGWFMGHIASYPNDWLTDPRFVAGFILMLAGAGINIWSEYSLYFLRSNARGGYALRRGGLFEKVLAPIYSARSSSGVASHS